MLPEPDPAEVARRIADATAVGVPAPAAFVILSTLDLAAAVRNRRRSKAARRRLRRRLVAVSNPVAVCQAWRSAGSDAARSWAAPESDPPAAWWCESRIECERTLASLIERRGEKSFAYDHGACDSLVRLTIWPD